MFQDPRGKSEIEFRFRFRFRLRKRQKATANGSVGLGFECWGSGRRWKEWRKKLPRATWRGSFAGRRVGRWRWRLGGGVFKSDECGGFHPSSPQGIPAGLGAWSGVGNVPVLVCDGV